MSLAKTVSFIDGANSPHVPVASSTSSFGNDQCIETAQAPNVCKLINTSPPSIRAATLPVGLKLWRLRSTINRRSSKSRPSRNRFPPIQVCGFRRSFWGSILSESATASYRFTSGTAFHFCQLGSLLSLGMLLMTGAATPSRRGLIGAGARKICVRGSGQRASTSSRRSRKRVESWMYPGVLSVQKSRETASARYTQPVRHAAMRVARSSTPAGRALSAAGGWYRPARIWYPHR